MSSGRKPFRLEMSSYTPTLVHASLYTYVSLSLSTFLLSPSLLPYILSPSPVFTSTTIANLIGEVPLQLRTILLLHRNIHSYEQLHTYIRLSAFIPACQTPSLATPCRSSPSIQHRSWTTCLMLHKSPSNYGLMQSKTDSSQYSIGTLDTHAYSVYALC